MKQELQVIHRNLTALSYLFQRQKADREKLISTILEELNKAIKEIRNNDNTTNKD